MEREAEEKAVGNEIAGQVTFEDRGLLECAVVRLADAVGCVNARRGIAQCQCDLASLGCSLLLLMQIEQVL